MVVKMLWLECNGLNFQSSTVFVGMLHLCLLSFRLYEFVMDLILLEDYLDFNRLIYLILINLLQIAIIITAFVGVYKQNHYYFIPWLFFTAPIFLMTTLYAVLYAVKGVLFQVLLNFLMISVFWTSWAIVLKNYFNIKQLNQNRSYTDYGYTHLKTES